ncbi:MAG: hypothetical protein ACXWE9_03210 [Methylobacter sp.]
MSDDQRSHGARSLREFFDDQLRHLQNLADSLGSHLHGKERQTKEDRMIVESFVDASNSKMRAVHDYSYKLRGHVQGLYNHVLEVADRIPPPVGLSLDAFRTDPLVNALFVNSNDVERLFATDSDVNAYLRSHSKYQVPVVYGLLTANKSEKRILGIGRQGDMLIREVPRQVVNFSSYKIHTPCASSAELNSALKKYLFDRVVTLVRQEMTARKINQFSETGNDSYEAQVKSLANPDVYLDALVEYLETPGNLLSIDKVHLKLSKLGVKLDDDDNECANEFDIHELTWSNNTRNVMLQINHTR